MASGSGREWLSSSSSSSSSSASTSASWSLPGVPLSSMSASSMSVGGGGALSATTSTTATSSTTGGGKALALHRCKFVAWVPSAVVAATFDPTCGRLAVARASGDIELWSCADSFYMIATIYGLEGVNIRSLVWLADSRVKGGSRLFSSGLHAHINEWDLDRLTIKNSVDAFGSAVWAMTASPSANILATGSDDGTIRLFDTDNDSITYFRSLARVEDKIISLAWHPSKNIIYAGGEGTIRCWDVDRGQVIFRMSVDSHSSDDPIVWCLRVLSDSTVVSGSSAGMVQFWDGDQGTLIHSFRDHKADVMALTVDASEKTVFASGVDQKIAQFQYLKSPHHNSSGSEALDDSGRGGGRWVSSNRRRVHTHDVNVLVLSPTNVLVSGGVDAQLHVYNTNAFTSSSQPHKVSPFPPRHLVSFSPSSRLMLVNLSRRLELWSIGSLSQPSVPDVANGTKLHHTGHKNELELQLSGHNIACLALSSSAHYLACSDAAHIKIFEVNTDSNGLRSAVKVNLKGSGLLPAVALEFTPDESHLIIATHDATVQVFDLAKRTLVATLSDHRDSWSGPGAKRAPLVSIAVSPGGEWAAIGDAANRIVVYATAEWKKHTVLPVFSAPHTTLSFSPHGPLLVVPLTSNHIYVYDVVACRLSDWTVANVDKFPSKFMSQSNSTTGVTFDPSNPTGLIVYHPYAFHYIDMAHPLPSPTALSRTPSSAKDMEVTVSGFPPPASNGATPSSGSEGGVGSGTSGSTNNASPPANFRAVTTIKPILFLSFIDSEELAVVERPWLDVMESFPRALQKKRYGVA